MNSSTCECNCKPRFKTGSLVTLEQEGPGSNPMIERVCGIVIEAPRNKGGIYRVAVETGNWGKHRNVVMRVPEHELKDRNAGAIKAVLFLIVPWLLPPMLVLYKLATTP